MYPNGWGDHMEVPRQRGAAILTEMKELGVRQASLTADKQEPRVKLVLVDEKGQPVKPDASRSNSQKAASVPRA